MKYDHIVIEREYGSGGTGIGKILSEKIGIPKCIKYIQADAESRRQGAMKEYGIPQNVADATMAKFDKKRRNYYLTNTGKKWKDWSNYDMILDSGKLGIHACVRIIQAALE